MPRDDSSIASGSSGFGSLTKTKPEKPEFYSNEMDPTTFISSVITDSGISESSDAAPYPIAVDTISNNHNSVNPMLPSSMQQALTSQTNSSPGDIGHSRNSSNTSQVNEPTVKMQIIFVDLYRRGLFRLNFSFLIILDVQRIWLQ